MNTYNKTASLLTYVSMHMCVWFFFFKVCWVFPKEFTTANTEQWGGIGELGVW